jgi:hypothetical protein
VVVQFSGWRAGIHPEIVPILRAAKQRNICHVILNTNGKPDRSGNKGVLCRRVFQRWARLLVGDSFHARRASEGLGACAVPSVQPATLIT